MQGSVKWALLQVMNRLISTTIWIAIAGLWDATGLQRQRESHNLTDVDDSLFNS